MRALNSRIGTFLKCDPAVATSRAILVTQMWNKQLLEGLTIKTTSESRVQESELIYPANACRRKLY